jgi:hypothetical protein
MAFRFLAEVRVGKVCGFLCYFDGEPTDECHGETGGFLGLPGDVAGDERDDHVALREEELRAVEGDEQAGGVVVCGFDGYYDGGADYRGDGPELGLGNAISSPVRPVIFLLGQFC